jgi:hypothetical protein
MSDFGSKMHVLLTYVCDPRQLDRRDKWGVGLFAFQFFPCLCRVEKGASSVWLGRGGWPSQSGGGSGPASSTLGVPSKEDPVVLFPP